MQYIYIAHLDGTMILVMFKTERAKGAISAVQTIHIAFVFR